jgi:hypothetical protein
LKINLWYSIKSNDNLRMPMVAHATMSVTVKMLLVMTLTRHA